ncbi:potassium channel subfamily K member 5 isoform X2 [Hemicordylus capensis]|uniref:potassium channel subfamily K member 5 isoform X2 n=1 Tax=Hemicordylus capensis TaxID=884348 RepID=UPI002302757C|nr:potassium channel subfamily K member 5 isoform X2 [Hemicordylus capensis]
MVDRGPLLTSAIIFYLSIGAAIFEVLERPHWKTESLKYKARKSELLKEFPCLGQEGLDKILQRKAQITCTAIFIIWGVLVHLVLPPFVFMVTEGWSYIEGLYFSFITITTIGFGDFVAGVNPNGEYHSLYRYFVELWIYLGLAWLSLFVNWKVSMFVEVHKAIKKRRKKRKGSFENHPPTKKALQMPNPKDVNIFSFLSKKEETYNDLIKQIGKKALKTSNDKILKAEQAKPTSQHTSKDVKVMYTKNNLFDYDEVSLGLQNYHVMRHLTDRRIGDSPVEGNVFVNQLDRISEEEGEAWDSRDYRPLIFENANITFVNEDEDEEEDISDDEETSKSSVDDNLAGEPESPQKLVKFSSSDESTFTSNELEISVPYEQLMNEYNTVNNNAKAAT